MQRIRYFLLAIVCFLTAILIPGTFVNRLFSTVMCAVFSFNWGACTVNLAKTSDRVVAAFPPSLERNIDNWLTQRSGEFDDESSPPAPVNNQQAPPYPQEISPDYIRDEFRDEINNRREFRNDDLYEMPYDECGRPKCDFSSILKSGPVDKYQKCFGASGGQCGWDTRDRDPLHPPQYRPDCRVEMYETPGSRAHDQCCLDHPRGYACSGWGDRNHIESHTPPILCEREFIAAMAASELEPLNPNSQSELKLYGPYYNPDYGKECSPTPPTPQPPTPTPIPQVVPGGGGSHGDPHLTTLDGQKYDYQAVGEFVLTRTKNRQFEIQVRQAPFKNINTAAINAAVAMKVGDARVGIYATGFPDDQTKIPLRIDGKPVELKGTQNLAGGGSITQNGGTSWTVQWPTGEVANFEIADPGGSPMIDLSTGVTENDQGQLEGLLGNFNGNPSDDFMTRDGRIIPQNQEAMDTARSVLSSFNINRWIPIPIDPLTEAFLDTIHSQFGNSWRISQTESLFDYAPGKNTGTFTNPAFPNGFVILRMLAPDAVAKAEEACRKAEVPSDRLEGCLFDVAVTGETGFARVAANFLKNKVRQRVEREIRNRIPIPVPLPF
ncbi:VWD domain-containing protein [Planktothrix sp. FACHB-1365]|uniref:VWD domain-containing protein n=1 Tax=Planktothrix sp. FACHB-1365 TaxID=2692855 RepID=UPI00168A0C00|nr:VWD domain-containing protein [Planktothrix sp. FACHB-1365]MBD2485494.1 VWD domain-containing protein [Planktothrix sp. FACHB-1365]